MFKNYLITIVRNFWSQRLYSVLNVLGLSIALAVSILIYSYVREEISYDRHFPKANCIYRIVQYHYGNQGPNNWANGAPLTAEEITGMIPEIEQAVRIRPAYGLVIEHHIDSVTKVTHQEAGGFFADSGFVDMFDVKIITGDSKNPLSKPRSLVITEKLANKYFGNEDPIGNVLKIGGGDFTVRAVMKEFPITTHFRPDYLIDWHTFIRMIKNIGLEDLYYNKHWAGVYTYVQLNEKVKVKDLSDKIADFRVEFFSDEGTREEILQQGKFVLQPITDIHLKSHLEQEIGPNGNIIYVMVFTLAAIFILIIAGVNYINIATARAFSRMKEVGIRKVTGAFRHQLIAQFMGEAIFIVTVSALLSILLADLLIPFYNHITGKTFTTSALYNPETISVLILIILVLGFISGLYPAFFVSNFKPVDAIKELKDPTSTTNKLRTGLVILQFAVSIFMIFSTVLIYRQMNYFLNKDLGFDKENMAIMPLNGKAYQLAVHNPETLKNELGKLPFIKGITMISHLPGDRFSVEGIRPEGVSEEQDMPSMRFLRVDEDFIPLLNIEIIKGRNLKSLSGDQSEYVLNQKAVEVLNLEEPTGINVTSFFGQYGEIVGVCQDFHYASLHHVIEPLVLEINNNTDFRNLWINFLLIRIIPGDVPTMLKKIEQTLEKIAQGTIVNFQFLDENLNKNYKSEYKLRDLFRAFAVFAIFISCLGLFGLSAFSTELRTKEVGIRKAMGAKLFPVSILLSRKYILLILVSLCIALPGGYFFIHNWLQNFAYHIDINSLDFILSAFLAIIIAIIAVSYQSIRAGRTNPVEALRYE